jgi:FkbM family methyltransferase
MAKGKRSLKNILLAPFRFQHYVAALRAFVVLQKPMSGLARYLTSVGTYPTVVGIRTPLGVVHAHVFSHHDMLTVTEIFCRNDYPATANERVVVDFGSNIGISALFFLSRGSDVYCYLHEPLPFNIERLRQNLGPYEGRFHLAPIAVGLSDGTVEFGYEDSGRYGGIGLSRDKSIIVNCRDARNVISEILERHEYIDILKIDIESLEKEILALLPASQLCRIRRIYIEQRYSSNPFPDGMYAFRQYYGIAQFFATSSRLAAKLDGEIH